MPDTSMVVDLILYLTENEEVIEKCLRKETNTFMQQLQVSWSATDNFNEDSGRVGGLVVVIGPKGMLRLAGWQADTLK